MGRLQRKMDLEGESSVYETLTGRCKAGDQTAVQHILNLYPHLVHMRTLVSPTYIACQYRRYKLVEYLLSKNPSFNDGYLHPYFYLDLKIIKIFLEHKVPLPKVENLVML